MRPYRSTFLLILACFNALGFEDNELARATQSPLARNPKAKYTRFPLLNSFNTGYGINDNFQWTANVKPLVPLAFTRSTDLILRPILQFYHQPNEESVGRYINGIGDFNPTAFFSPFYVHKEFDWGVGPSLYECESIFASIFHFI